MRAERNFKPLPLEAVALLGEGNVGEAVRSVREAEGVGRREARRRIDAHLARDPILRVHIETQQRERRRRFFLWFVVIDLAIVAGFVCWFVYRGST
jgi:hypothetical protein